MTKSDLVDHFPGSGLDDCCVFCWGRTTGRQGWIDMGVSKNRGTPKWMVYKEHPIEMDHLGVPPF